jgi:anti-anti-sigma factor
MDISVTITDNRAYIAVSGEVDTLDAEGHLSEIEGLHEDAHDMDFDLERVSYISSSGLRVLLRAKNIA